jgi:hypothetical protein
VRTPDHRGLQVDRASLEENLAAQEHRRGEAEAELRVLQAQLQRINASRTWQLLAPLRWVYRTLVT